MRKKNIGIIFFVLLLLAAVFLAVTQENGGSDGAGEATPDSSQADAGGETEPEESAETEPIPEWTPPAPSRWFRSNAGGMALEEVPSRLAALRNEYALVIDYIRPEELPELLLPFFHTPWEIEIRVLFNAGGETRRQWIFRDENGQSRLVAVFQETESPGETAEAPAAPPDNEESQAAPPMESADETGGALAVETEIKTETEEKTEAAPSAGPKPALTGFIEVYNENYQITEEYQYSAGDDETITEYFYREKTLIRAEAREKIIVETGESWRKLYTDTYRYNRSASLRSVERLYHEQAEAEPVRLAFPNRILDAASDTSFFSEKLPPASDFFGDAYVGEGYRMVYATDDRGRILSQTLLDKEDQEVWVIKNTWDGERIVSAVKVEGEVKLLAEYEYDAAGNRILERNVRNGVLERLVRTDGKQDTEELYMNGVVILRALWEDGRKISEERVRSN